MRLRPLLTCSCALLLLTACVPAGSSGFNPFTVGSAGSVTLGVGKTSFVRIEFSAAQSEALVPQPASTFLRYASSLPLNGGSYNGFSVNEFSFSRGSVPAGWEVSLSGQGLGFEVSSSASGAGSTVQATATVRARASLTLSVLVPASASLSDRYVVSGLVVGRDGAAVPINLAVNLSLSTR